MSDIGWLAFYSISILLFSLAGGYLPFRGGITHDRLQLYLSLAAGVMLGAAFFHVMPDALEYCGPKAFGWWISLGAVGTFCIERFIAPHSHEVNGHHHHHAGHNHGGEHLHAEVEGRRAAAPGVGGWMAVLGLTLHTFMNGVALAGGVESDLHEKSAHLMGGLSMPGLILFLAIVLHKPADALAISAVLSRKGTSPWKLTLVQIGFALMVPVGATCFLLTKGALKENMQSQLIGAALAFSAGTFLFIALSDLLPEVQFHRHDRIPLFLALAAGIVLMAAIAYLEVHEEHEHPPAAEVTPRGWSAEHYHVGGGG
jgi:zinc and cadmium transporter